jgi:hypothetical protein
MRRMARTFALSPFFSSFDDAAGVLVPLAYLLYWWLVTTARLLFAMSCHTY